MDYARTLVDLPHGPTQRPPWRTSCRFHSAPRLRPSGAKWRLVAARECPVGYFVDGAPERHGVGLVANDPRRRRAKPSKRSTRSADHGSTWSGSPKWQRSQIDLDPGPFRAARSIGQEAGPVITAGRSLDEVPTQRVARRPTCPGRQQPVVALGADVVPGLSDDVDAPAGVEPHGGALEASHEPRAEQGGEPLVGRPGRRPVAEPRASPIRPPAACAVSRARPRPPRPSRLIRRQRLPDHLIHVVIAIGREPSDEGHVGVAAAPAPRTA